MKRLNILWTAFWTMALISGAHSAHFNRAGVNETPKQWSKRTGLPLRCCGINDCLLREVRLIESNAKVSRVVVDKVEIILPSSNVFSSADGRGRWCAKDISAPISRENTRCVGLPPPLLVEH